MYTYAEVWSESFDVDGPPDSSRWTHALGHGHNGWGNAELQSYSDAEEACRVEGGRLVITGEKLADGTYRSARIHTGGKASWRYGRFEVRAKLPRGRGTWPAIWFLGDGILQGEPWPGCGEIDLMEHLGRRPGEIHHSLHTGTHNHVQGTQWTSHTEIEGVADGFHTYRMDWTAEGFRFFVDDEPTYEVRREDHFGPDDWPFDRPHHLILNLALGGHWGGEVDDEALPARLEVEFVRVWQARD